MNNEINQAMTPERLYSSSPSRLSDHILCERYNFFNNILRWKKDEANIHLETGTAIHLMLEHILRRHRPGVPWSEELMVDAFSAFLSHYRRFFPQSSDHDNIPKDPGTCLSALMRFRDIMYPRLENTEVPYTEVSGTIPITDKFTLNFRIDAIIRDERGFGVLDFKTCSKDSKANRSENHLKPAMGTYVHAVESVLGNIDRVWGAEFVLLVLKKEPDIIPIPIIQTPEMMLNWHWNTRYHFENYLWNMEQLKNCKPEDPLMYAFPQRSSGCVKYGLCKHWDHCWAWPNPLQHLTQPPLGFKIAERFKQEEGRPARYKLVDGALIPNEKFDEELKQYEDKVVEEVDKISSLGPQLYSNSIFE